MMISALTSEVQEALDRVEKARAAKLVELRFRRGQAVRMVFPWGEELLTCHGSPIPVTEQLLGEMVDRATGFSPYACKLEETGLYLPLEGGCRMGLCGETVIRDGKIWGIRNLSSAVVRIARERKGAAQSVMDTLLAGNHPHSALILSPPGEGKTTFLRDLIRLYSEAGNRVSVIDQRRELAAQRDGENMLDLGPCTDVLSGCPKAQGMELMLRVMNPQVMAVDELSGEDELLAARQAAFSGVALLATAHGDSMEGLCNRPGFRNLIASGAFDYWIELEHYRVKRLERLGHDAEAGRRDICGSGVLYERVSGPAEPEPENRAASAASTGAGAAAK